MKLRQSREGLDWNFSNGNQVIANYKDISL